ncbi:MAG: hypothetical protein H0W83_06390 [Planctomycetes bacterium]|nr:hypothetical protein [Planctomycetota bacterium]
MTFIIQTPDGQHLGSILMSESAADPLSGHCVFVAVPKDPLLVAKPAYKRLVMHREMGEHQFQRTPCGDSIRISCNNSLYFVIQLDGEGKSGTMISGPGQESIQYSVARVPKKA